MKILNGKTVGSALRGTTEVAPRVYQVPLFGTSAFLLLEDQVTVIDAGWRGNGRRVLKSLSRLGRSAEEIAYIISTHYHLDHIGGMAHLRQNCSGKVAAHESEAPFIQLAENYTLPNPIPNRLLAYLITPILALLKPDQVPVDIQLQHGSRLEPLGGMEVIHCPGHTPGSISLHFPQEGLLIVGDALQYRGSKLGLPARMFCSDMEAAKDSVRRLASLDFEVVCFSHFPPIKKNATRILRQFADSLG